MDVVTVANTPWMEAWVEELRKDPPKTTNVLNRVADDALHLPARRCCLGVLLDVEGVKGTGIVGDAVRYGGETAMPPVEFTQAHLGVAIRWTLHGFSRYWDRRLAAYDSDLATINDRYGLSHAQHADLIAYFGVGSRT